MCNKAKITRWTIHQDIKPFTEQNVQGLHRQFNGTSSHKILLEIFTESLVSILKSNCNIYKPYL